MNYSIFQIMLTQNKELFLRTMKIFSVVIFVFYYGFEYILKFPAYFMLLGVLLMPKLVDKWYYWFMLWLLMTYDLHITWIGKANHGWTMWYWATAIMLSYLFVTTKDKWDVLQNNARWMLIIIMLVAVGWKMISPEYMNGTFFENNLISNELMLQFSAVVGDLSLVDLNNNIFDSSRRFTELPESGTRAVELISSPLMNWYGWLAAWWVLLIEFAIGFLLLFYKRLPDYWAHLCHIWFMVGAYASGPVMGFAWIIWLLGYVLAYDQPKYIKYAYMITAGFFFFYTIPWNEYVLHLIDQYSVETEFNSLQ